MKEYGLSFKGGLARGFGGLGVAEFLYNQGIRPKVVAGSSSGAIVAAALAAGFEPKEAIEFISKFSFWSICSVWSVLMKKSVVDDTLYRRSFREIFGDKKIEDLPIKLVIFATDATTKERIFIEEGDLVTALMASSSFRPIFPAVQVEGKQLIDGDLTESYSSGILRQLGSKVVIGVAYDKAGRKKEDVDIEILYPIARQGYINFHPLLQIAKDAFFESKNLWPEIKILLTDTNLPV